MDRKIDLPRTAETIQLASPDIVALQEVDNKVRRSEKVDQAKELASLTGMNHVFGRSIRLGGGLYGNAVLTKLTIKSTAIIPLPGRELRSALCLTLKTPHAHSAAEFLFVATHLDLNKKARIASIPIIEKLVESHNDIPAILAGDLNAAPGSQTMLTLEESWENTAGANPLFTFPARKPKIKIDHILYRPLKAYSVLETRVLDDAMASDHRPVFTVLKVEKRR